MCVCGGAHAASCITAQACNFARVVPVFCVPLLHLATTQLVVFLAGNLMTGACNLSINTLGQTDTVAVLVVTAYMVCVCGAALLVDAYHNYYYDDAARAPPEAPHVRAVSRSIPPQWGSVRFRPLACTCAPSGCTVRADELTKSRKIPTRGVLPPPVDVTRSRPHPHPQRPRPSNQGVRGRVVKQCPGPVIKARAPPSSHLPTRPSAHGSAR